MKKLLLDGESLDVRSVVEVAIDPSIEVGLTQEAWERCDASRRTVTEILASGRPVYGVNTGFGALARVRVDDAHLGDLQRNLIHSHAVGVGRPFPDEVVRATLLLRLNTLAKGYSGVSRGLLEQLIALLDHDILPVIPEKGSLGASGDLAPLSHMSLVLMGEGLAKYQGATIGGGEALRRAGLEPLQLSAKEGLALINGTPVMTALACLSVARALNLLKASTITAALSIEALRATDVAFCDELQRVRPHHGQIEIARYLRELLRDSGVVLSHRDCPKVQDSYSIRCIPQVHGACLEAWEHCARVVEVEINSATDNPLVIGNRVISGGNFHGEPIGLSMDFLSIALCELGSIAERRIARLMNSTLSELPPFLVEDSGLNSGMMITHYTAASLVMESRILAHPATVDSLPTSADQEDHVSMATTAARKTFEIMQNLTHILSIELLDAVQGVEFLRPLKSSLPCEVACRLVRERVPRLTSDRLMIADLAHAQDLISSGRLAHEVELSAGRSASDALKW